jgi:hypothetical protein
VRQVQQKEDQEMAEACKRFIKNTIICWNYLYLSQETPTASRTAPTSIGTFGSTRCW